MCLYLSVNASQGAAKGVQAASALAVWKLDTSPHMINSSAVCECIWYQLLAAKVRVPELQQAVLARNKLHTIDKVVSVHKQTQSA